MPTDDLPTTRRDFVTHLGLGGLALAVTGCATAAAPAAAPAPAAPDATPPGVSAPVIATPQAPAPARTPIIMPPTTNDGPWDMSWLDRTAAAPYSLVFDVGSYMNGGGLFYAKNYLNGMRDGWGAAAPAVMPILGISGDAYPIVFNDGIWEKYGYGTRSKTNDPRTGQPATRNVYWQPRAGESMAEYGVDVLQSRGAQFLLCNNVFRGVIRGAMQQTQGSYADVRKELTAGLLPGVIIVPALVAAMSMAQKRGASYVFAGA